MPLPESTGPAGRRFPAPLLVLPLLIIATWGFMSLLKKKFPTYNPYFSRLPSPLPHVIKLLGGGAQGLVTEKRPLLPLPCASLAPTHWEARWPSRQSSRGALTTDLILGTLLHWEVVLHGFITAAVMVKTRTQAASFRRGGNRASLANMQERW